MKYRVHELARQASLPSQEVIATLRVMGEYVRTSASAVEEPVARDFLEAQGVPWFGDAEGTGTPAASPTLTPATTYTWQANPVRAPKSHEVLWRVNQLESAFPVAADHLRMLRALGSEFVYAETLRANDGQTLGAALARFSGAIEAAFGITREVMFFYTPYHDLQIRTFMKCQEVLSSIPKQATPDFVMFSSPDKRLAIKLEDWSRLSFTAIPLAGNLGSEPIELIRLIRDYIYARDLFYETTPVRGDRFFGRKAMLQELRDDVINQRVSGVFGLRKSGKTSLLLHLAELMDSDQTIFAFVDLEVLPSPPQDPTEQLIDLVASQVQSALNKKGYPSPELDELKNVPSSDRLKRSLERTLTRLEARGARLVLLLDEIEFLTPIDKIDTQEGSFSGVAQSLGVLRSLVQGSQNFTFLVSGLTNDIIENGRLYGRPNPLFSWAKARYIGPLSRVEADELANAVGARMGIEIEQEALRTLYEASGGHAYLYRNLASAVVAQLPVDTYRRIMRRSDVMRQVIPWKRSIAGNIEEIIGHLERYYPTESILLQVLLDSPVDFAMLAEGENRAVHHLVSLGLIHERGGVFEPSSLMELR